MGKRAHESKKSPGLPIMNAHAAGIDIGDTAHYVAISNGQGGHEVKRYGTFTEDLQIIVRDLKARDVTTAAMESTGVYWLALYLLLEEAGIEPYLVNAAHAKNVTGRKKDDTDAIWLQKLHSCGLLQKSFQPEEEIRVLRTYVRQRKNLIAICSDSVRRMQKALELMNLKVHTVISDILGKTGMEIMAAILNGERDPIALADLRDPRIKAPQDVIIKSLTGIWRPEYLFMLEQAHEEYQFYQKQIQDTEEKIRDQLLKQIAVIYQGDISTVEVGAKNKKKAKKNQFSAPIGPLLRQVTGVDLCKIPGISEVTALEYIAEVGCDMSKWETPKRFAAWNNVVPNNKITGEKIIRSALMKKKNKAGQCLRMAACTLWHDRSPFGDYYRIHRAKCGGKGAVVITAHKMSRMIFIMLRDKVEYNPDMLTQAQKSHTQRRIKQLERQLQRLKTVA